MIRLSSQESLEMVILRLRIDRLYIMSSESEKFSLGTKRERIRTESGVN